MVSHVWKLLSLKESLWVRWIHAYKLNGRSFWDVPLRGNGANTSLWYDRWCDNGPLSTRISTRDVFRAGLNLSTLVKDIIYDGSWIWPLFLLEKYPFLNSCSVPVNKGALDKLEWRCNGVNKAFSVSQVWSNIRPRGDKVEWYNMVWFNSYIPRHAFNLWLIVKRKLKTQDMIRAWDVSGSLGTSCALCEMTPDSYEHLFFDCTFSQVVWSHMVRLTGFNLASHDIYSLISSLQPDVKRRTTKSVIVRLVIAASAYFVWQEHNWRLFKSKKRMVSQVIDCVVSSVRLKLLSCKLKNSKDGQKFATLWDLPEAIFF
ncbi:reverse transcriptase zinc-binding domain-containing protein [Tanacetum coccineum]